MNENKLAVSAAIIARLTAGQSDRASDLQNLLAALPDPQHKNLARLVAQYSVSTNLAGLCGPGEAGTPIQVMPADTILKTDWPEPVWAIPGLLPVGLAILAGAPNCVIFIIDHHKKPNGFNNDVIADVLGSTAKPGTADTILGLYRERGKAGAKLDITGREVEERSLDLVWDTPTGCWQLDSAGQVLTPQRNNLIGILTSIGPTRLSEIAGAVGRQRGNVYKQLVDLAKLGRVKQVKQLWVLADYPPTQET